jgi:predicted nucleic acid-binding protein
MIVVSNTSPLTNLAAIGQFALLQQLYGTVCTGSKKQAARM